MATLPAGRLVVVFRPCASAKAQRHTVRALQGITLNKMMHAISRRKCCFASTKRLICFPGAIFD